MFQTRCSSKYCGYKCRQRGRTWRIDRERWTAPTVCEKSTYEELQEFNCKDKTNCRGVTDEGRTTNRAKIVLLWTVRGRSESLRAIVVIKIGVGGYWYLWNFFMDGQLFLSQATNLDRRLHATQNQNRACNTREIKAQSLVIFKMASLKCKGGR